MSHELTRGVDDDDLASGSKARIDSKDRLPRGGWGEKELTEIRCKHTNRLLLGDFSQRGQHFGRYRRLQQAGVAVGHRRFELAAEHETGIRHQATAEGRGELGVVDVDRQRERVFRFATSHGEKTVGGEPRDRLAKVVEGLEPMVLAVIAALLLRLDAAAAELIAQPGARRRILRPAFGDNIGGTFQSSVRVFHFVSGIDERLEDRGPGPVEIDLGHKDARERVEAAFTSDCRPGLARALVWQIEVVHFARVVGTDDRVLQFTIVNALLEDRLQYSILAIDELPGGCQGVLDGPDLDLVEPAGALFAVSGDKGNRTAV